MRFTVISIEFCGSSKLDQVFFFEDFGVAASTSSPGAYIANTSPVGLECLFDGMCKNPLLMV